MYYARWYYDTCFIDFMYISKIILEHGIQARKRSNIRIYIDNNQPTVDTRHGFNEIFLYAIPLMIFAIAVFIPLLT